MNFNKNKKLFKLYDVEKVAFSQQMCLKKLAKGKKKSVGRSSGSGSIVTWHKGGGVKRNYRSLFFSQPQEINDIYGIIRSIDYDPNRSSFIGIVQFQNGSFTNMVLSSESKVNDIIKLTQGAKDNENLKAGDLVKLRYLPIGVPLFNLEKYPGSGPVFSKAAGVFSTLLTKDLDYGKVRLSSGEEYLFDLNCKACLGKPSNIYHKYHKKYKAGTNRLLNIRPTVRGVAMNPIDHPHGGGQGKTGAGRPSVSPWGKLTKNVPTRNSKIKNKFIVKRRK